MSHPDDGPCGCEESVALRAENERLRANWRDEHADVRMFESQLAAANALLAELNHKATIPYTEDGNDLARRVQAHLSGQPAAPCKCVGCRNGFSAYCEVLDGGVSD